MSDKEYIETFEISNDVIKQKDDGKRIQSEKSKNEEDLGPQLKGSKKIKCKYKIIKINKIIEIMKIN